MTQEETQPYNWDSQPLTVHIPTVQHGLFAVQSLIRQAEESADLALTNLQERDITLAASALECAEHYADTSRRTLEYIRENIEHRLHQDQTEIELAATGKNLNDRINEIRESINRATGPAYLDADRVNHHADHYHNVLNLSELRRIADTLEQTHNRGPEWSEDLHSAHIIRAEALAYGTSPFHEPSHSEPEETPPEDIRTEESLATQANDAKTAMRELTEPMLRKYDESLPTDVSPSIAAVPELAKKLREAITPPAGALIGFHITGPHSGDTVGLPDGPKNNDHPATTIIHISIVYRARKVIKSLVDPYPKGYPAILAAAHAAVASRMLQEAIDSEIDNPASRDQRTLGRMIHTLEQAIRTNLHDVTGSQIRHVLETAAKHGCPPAAQASMLSAATLEDQDLADTLAGNKSGAWRRTARQDQAQAVIDAGKNAGLDEYALDDLAWTMGFQGTELGVPVPKPTSDQLNAVFTATDEVDLPKRTRHMMTNAILNFHPHRARH